MTICKNLKDKIIIIAESDVKLADEISSFLKKEAFVNIRVANTGKQIYEILRPYYSEPEQIGLIVVNEQLPECNVKELCKTLATDQASYVPVIVLNENLSTENAVEPDNRDYINVHHYYFTLPVNYAEFLIVVGFQLIMKHERFLRYKQEQRLNNELSEKRIVDAKLKYFVAHDELTNLLNRQNFERQLRQTLNRSHMLGHNGALLFLDIDRFSLINELEGFETGDRLLVEVVAIIRKLVSEHDLFARIGSDEFCLFLENRTSDDILKFAEKIRQSVFEHRFFTGDVCYSISLSIGIALQNAKSVIFHPGEIISKARQSCNMAKEHGRNMVWEYNENDAKVQERHKDLYWVPLIRKSLVEDRFFLVYQPVVDLTSGDVSHYEVLIRMRDEDDEIISPGDFIPVAERMGLIHNIDLWVVDNAIDFLSELPMEMSGVSLSINLSSMAFQDVGLLPAIKEKLELTWVDPSCITFEITETAAVDNFEQTRDMIEKISALGCKFALDDFGAGFCSFNYLKTFPVDYVKIDGQFIQNLLDDENDQILVKSMAELATNLGKKTIAEFVETTDTILKLKEIGVNFGQGYIFGKPQTELLSIDTLMLGHSSLNKGKRKMA